MISPSAIFVANAGDTAGEAPHVSDQAACRRPDEDHAGADKVAVVPVMRHARIRKESLLRARGAAQRHGKCQCHRPAGDPHLRWPGDAAPLPLERLYRDSRQALMLPWTAELYST